MQNVVEN